MAQQKTKDTSNKKVRLSFSDTINNRSGVLTKDARLYNLIPESYKSPWSKEQDLALVKRPGLAPVRSYTAGTARGVFRWKTNDYVAIGGTVYKNGTSHKAINGTSGHVGFTIIDDEGTEKLCFADGTSIYVTDGTTVTTIPASIGVWTVDTVMVVGDRRVPTVENGFYYQVTQVTGDAKTHAATQPTWPTVIGDEVVDDKVSWKCAGYYSLTVDAWVLNTAYTAGAIVRPSTANGYMYQCTVAGTSDATEPVWPLVLGNTVVDNTVTWQCISELDTTNPMPKNHLPYPVALNNILYLIAKDSSGNATSLVYNSGISTPSSWNQVDFRSSNMYPDNLQCIVRHHNYIAAFGDDSLEFLYDASNASGSPLALNDSLSFKIGTRSPETVVQTERSLMFVGTTSEGGWGVWEVVNYTPKKVSSEFVDRILEGEGSNVSTARGFVVKCAGHHLYIIRLTSRTLVYDIDEKLWHEWSSNSSGNHAVWTGAYSHDAGTGVPLVLGATDGVLYTLSPTNLDDNGVDILCELYTKKIDFDEAKRKFYHEMNIIMDEAATGTISARWSYDDYSTWCPFQTHATDSLPISFHRLGASRTLIVNLKYSDATALRLKALEFDVSLGMT